VAEPLIVTRTTTEIARLDPAARARIAERPPTREEHARQFAGYPGLHEIEIGALPAARAPLESPARILFWNAERGKFPGPAAELLDRLDAAAILLCELDLGMARSGQAHIARELAQRLGMGYAFGVEFLELGLGDAFEQRWHAGLVNEAGLHGAAILSPFPLERPALIRLESDGNWFDGAHGERRVGGRMAMVATLRIDGRPVTLAGVHFESHSDPEGRAGQLRRLLDALDRYGGDQPVLIGGDLNTSTLARGWARGSGAKPVLPAARLLDPTPYEPLFRVAAAAGYDWRACNAVGVPTQRTRPDGTPAPPLGKLDWFLARGLEVAEPRTIPAVDAGGRALSDHEVLAVTVTLRAPTGRALDVSDQPG
jgi:endonuclease/exonuclease/phosphatase family metal-dependent hydrolase